MLTPVYLSRHQAARYLGIGIATLDRWRKRARVRDIWINGRVMFSQAELETVRNAKR